MTWIHKLKIIITILLISISTLHAATIPLTSDELDYLKKHPIIRVGVDQNWPPFDYYHPLKGHQGLSSSFLNEVATRLGIELEYYPAPWKDVLDAIKNNQVDMLACAAKTPQRETYLTFTDPYIQIDTAVYVQKMDQSIQSIEDLNGKVVSLPKGNFLHDYLTNSYPEIQFEFTLSNEEAIDLVAQGKVDAYIGNMAAANYFIEENFITNTKISFKLDNKKTGFSFATSNNDLMLHRLLQKALNSLDAPTHKTIIHQWLRYFSNNEPVSADLTTAERQWIRNNPTLTIGTGIDWPPYDFTANNQYQGVARDYLDLLEEKLGLSFIYAPPQRWEILQQQLLMEQIDVLPATYITQQSNFIFSQPYTQAQEFIFVNEQTNDIKQFDDIANKCIVFVTGSETLPTILKQFPNITTLAVETIDQALQALIDQKADLYIDTYGAVTHVSKREGFIGIKALFPVNLIDTRLHMATLNKNSTLLSVLNKGLNEITAEERTTISERWQNAPEKKKINFSPLEQQWIDNNPVVTISGDPHSGPLSFFDKKGQYSGILCDYIALISERTGLTFKPLHLGSFDAALDALKKQKIDIVDAAAYSHGRSKQISFTTDHIQTEYSIIVRKGRFSPRNLDDLSHRHVGIIAGYLIEEKLKKDASAIQIQSYSSYEQGLQDLSKGKLDAFIIDLPTLDFVSEKLGISNIKVSGSTPYTFPLRFAVAKDAQLLRTILNKALASIDSNERKEIYRNWITFEYEAEVDYTLVWQISGVLFLVITGTLFWSWRLAQEIKRRRKVEEELLRAKNTAELATRAKSEFLANMSHEIRTPMNSVIGFTDLLDELIIDPVQKGYLRSIKIGGKALLGIINDILDLSKIEAGQLKLQYESINPYHLFLETEQLFYEKIKQKGLTLNIEVDPDIPEYVLFDGIRLRQILLNLVGNAIKFTEHGSITLKVRKVYKDQQKSKLDLEINVIDTGMGISEENLAHIFEDFQQQEGQSQRQFGGTGLGLSICKKLVAMMQGDISVISTQGKGSTFTVHLYDIDVSSIRSENKNERVAKEITFDNATVMVVDDVDNNRKLVRAIFTNTAISIVEAIHGQDALDQLNVVHVDLILMDLRMPVLNGYETVEQLRQQPQFEKIPIIALTASVIGEDLEKIDQFGFDGYIQKPAEKEVIMNKVAEFLPHHCKNETTPEVIDEKIALDKTTRSIILETLSGKLFEEWQAVKDKGDIELMRQFNVNLTTLADSYQIKYLQHYTKELTISIEGFDLTQLYSLMNQYPEMIENLQMTKEKG